MCVAFRIGFYSIFADSRLSAHASFDLHLSFGSVRGGGGGDDVHANATCVFCFSCCFLCVSHFASVFTVFFAGFRLFAHASLDLHLSFSSVRGWGGMGGGMMTSMRMRLVSSVSLVASYVCRISHRFLRCFLPALDFLHMPA